MQATSDWTRSLEHWARTAPKLAALVQVGSRVQNNGAAADEFSDFDYYLISGEPGFYLSGEFARQIAPCWSVSANVAFGGVTKVTAIYGDALETDFVILSTAEMRVALAALRFPATKPFWPSPMREGIANLRRVAGLGSKVIYGGEAWTRRFARVTPLALSRSEEDYKQACATFWTQLVWVVKKVQRGELVAAQRGFHVYLVESALVVFAMESEVDRGPRPEGRMAERWLNPSRLAALSMPTAPTRAVMANAILTLIDAFGDAASVVAVKNAWRFDGAPEVRRWIVGQGW